MEDAPRDQPDGTVVGAGRAALIVGNVPFFVRSVARLLTRAGCVCEAVSGSRRILPSRSLHRVAHLDSDHDRISEALRWRERSGGLLVLTDDQSLRFVVDSSLSPAEKCLLVPVTAAAHLGHVGSKVGLARTLLRAGVPQPAFRVAESPDMLRSACEAIGFPAVVKIDRSGGGDGVFACRSAADVAALSRRGLPMPLLVQEWIDGDTVDLSGFFRDGRPVHFTYAAFVSTIGGPFGVSRVREYTRLAEFGRWIFDDMRRLSVGLGLHGFANVTALRRRADGRLLFVEADLRPNVWVEIPRHMGDDPAPAIAAGLWEGRAMDWPPPPVPRRSFVVAHVFRQTGWRVVLNHHATWRQLGDHEPLDLVHRFTRRPGRWYGYLRGALPWRRDIAPGC